MQWTNKKVIVTGGAGVIGKELIKQLLEKGASIRCFDIAPKPKIFSYKIEYCREDLSKLNIIEFTSFEPQIIFHLAAAFERTKEDINFWESNYINNVLLSHKVISAAKECGNLKKIVFASSYLTYDPSLYLFKEPSSSAYKLKEKDTVNTRNLCGAAKYYTEKELEYLSNFRKEYPFDNISARIFRVYGKGSKDVISRWVRAGLKDKPIQVFLKENSFDYIFAEDVAKGLLKIAEKDGFQGVVNLGKGRARKVEEAVEIIKKYIPWLKTKQVFKKDLFEASCADMSYFTEQTAWQPETILEQGIKLITEYEKNKNKDKL